MNADEIFSYCLAHLAGTMLNTNWGERAIFYNPNNTLKKGVYLLTAKEKDGENDKASHVNRPGVFRLNLGVRKKTFEKLFGEIPKRPPAGGIVDMPYDFAALDIIMPHPVYAWMGWICVLNPSKETFDQLKPLIQESYEFAQEKFRKRKVG